ncbi:MAG: cysteine peptidase family C39 domain-containing protein [Chthoniobacter sp.]|nr:cysteine peptidase family C39 domain-containing protein [Chthoniobacter sp.]
MKRVLAALFAIPVLAHAGSREEILQEKGLWAVDSPLCGPCSTVLVMRYFADKTPFSEVNLALKRTPDGLVSLGEIFRFLTVRGFRVQGIEGGPADIREDNVAYILSAKADGHVFHFVFAAYDSSIQRWRIGDAMSDPQMIAVSAEDLEKYWSGVALKVSR